MADPTYTVHIGWGGAPEDGDETETYTFTTSGEVAAFLAGIEAAMGWQSYTVCNTPATYDAEDGEWRTPEERAERAAEARAEAQAVAAEDRLTALGFPWALAYGADDPVWERDHHTWLTTAPDDEIQRWATMQAALAPPGA